MNKSEMIERMASDADISKAAAERALESFTTSVQSTLKKGGSVTLVGFGSWSVTKRAARTGRNPKTGEAIKIKARKAPKFTPGKAFKDALN
ncbi:HU family DNA-binding protein [Acidovorax kalamii]|uniref:HU family DNA-binding protein n=1 Tax=Acidovorax kalamii TaxID=2004485 RepID=UPI0020908FD4|nr:HU family DNA-binding protein [Acidovorax kalamii]MCO5354203.1 HU family DNA-binding protein [Acidovorax kalamii]